MATIISVAFYKICFKLMRQTDSLCLPHLTSVISHLIILAAMIIQLGKNQPNIKPK